MAATMREAVDQAGKGYFETRKPRVKQITDRAKQMGDMKREKGVVEEWFTYLILWIIGKLPVDSYTRQIFNDLPVHEARKMIEKDKTPVAIHRS